MDRVAFSEPDPLRLVQCRGCGLVYRNPVERRQELTQIYARESPRIEMLRSLHDTQLPSARAQAHRLRAAFGRSGAGLEVGSYVGAFLTAAREVGLDVAGLDVNAGVNAFVRERGFGVTDGELTGLAGDDMFDLIAIWNTFDQVADPRATLHAASRLLRPHGLLVIRVPSGLFYARVRALLTARMGIVRIAARELLAQNNLLGFPYRWGFSVPPLERLLAATGFTVDRVFGDVLVPIADSYTRQWARLEEAAIKRCLGTWARLSRSAAPWLEVYARRA